MKPNHLLDQPIEITIDDMENKRRLNLGFAVLTVAALIVCLIALACQIRENRLIKGQSLHKDSVINSLKSNLLTPR